MPFHLNTTAQPTINESPTKFYDVCLLDVPNDKNDGKRQLIFLSHDLLNTHLKEQEKYKKLKQLPIEDQTFYYHKSEHNFLKHANVIYSRFETDSYIYWSSSTLKYKLGASGIYPKYSGKSGITYCKSTKKIKCWYGEKYQSLESAITRDIIITFKFEWIYQLDNSIRREITTSVIQKIIKGKVNNPRECITAIVKGNPLLKNLGLSTEVLWNYYKSDKGPFAVSSNTEGLYALTAALSVATNPNDIFCNESLDTRSSDIRDLIDQARMLSKKINFKWSERRAKQVHSEFTSIIMDKELERLEDKVYAYNGHLELESEYELITTKKQLYAEGKTMKHCVYTNYEYSINTNRYFVVRYHGSVRATIGLKIVDTHETSASVIVDQVKSYRNELIPDDEVQKIRDYFARPEIKAWFLDNASSNHSNAAVGYDYARSKDVLDWL